MADFLVDANILVYALDARDPFKLSRAGQVLDLLVQSDRGALSAQTLSEFFASTQRKRILPHDIAEAAVADLVRSWPVFDVTSDAVTDAIRGVRLYGFSYFDSLLWATAKENGIPTILSEDGQDAQVIEGVQRRNPLLAGFDVGLLE